MLHQGAQQWLQTWKQQGGGQSEAWLIVMGGTVRKAAHIQSSSRKSSTMVSKGQECDDGEEGSNVVQPACGHTAAAGCARDCALSSRLALLGGAALPSQAAPLLSS